MISLALDSGLRQKGKDSVSAGGFVTGETLFFLVFGGVGGVRGDARIYGLRSIF